MTSKGEEIKPNQTESQTGSLKNIYVSGKRKSPDTGSESDRKTREEQLLFLCQGTCRHLHQQVIFKHFNKLVILEKKSHDLGIWL